MIEFYENPNYEFLKNQEKRAINIDLKKSFQKQDLEMMYMQRGIGWLPNYVIELKNEKTAKVSLNANILNDAENIEDAGVSLVIGVPNFMYSNLESPLTSTQSFDEIMKMLESQGIVRNVPGRASMSNIMNQSSNSYVPAFASAEASDDSQETNTVSQQEDLYFYRIPHVTLKKSARASYEIFSSDLSYEHIYEVELLPNQNRNYSTEEGNENRELPRVWHSIKINNTTNYPLTTGTAMVVRNENGVVKPISQDNLNYTPAKSKVKVKLTSSPDIVVNPSEKEVERNENIHLKDNNYYDEVFVEAKASVKNNKKESIKLNMNRIITGSFLNSNYKPSINTLNIYQAQNKTNKVEWEINLKSGETKEIKYKYSLYVRR